jgi:hypothetical protein
MSRLLVLGFAALLLGFPAAASAGQPQCGDEVTTDVRLEADLLECPGDGLVATAPSITIDLDHQRLDGTGTGTGIRVLAADVTIRDGRIADFENGVKLPADGVGNAWLAGLELSHNDRGVALFGDSPWTGGSDGSVTIRNSRIHRNGLGVTANFWFHQTRISHSTVNANGSGISFRESRGATLSRNRIAANERTGVNFDFAGGGLVQRNVIDRNGYWGVIAYRSSQLTLAGNAVRRNAGGGAQVQDGFATIEGNAFTANDGPGLAVSSFLESRSLWPIRRNTANRNTGYGIAAAQPGFVGSGNVARHNGEAAQCLNFACARRPGR